MNLYKTQHPFEKDTQSVLGFPETIQIKSRFQLMLPKTKIKC